MNIASTTPPNSTVNCLRCQAVCCRLEVMLISETGVPEKFIATDEWGGRSMAQLADGWCAALDRTTMSCSIYQQRPQVCRDFEMGSYQCIAERAAYK